MAAASQADICQLGMDQRKVNMLAREYCDKIKRKLKPVILSHEMLPGLLEVQPRASLLYTPYIVHVIVLGCSEKALHATIVTWGDPVGGHEVLMKP